MPAEDARVVNYFYVSVSGHTYAVALAAVREVVFIAELSGAGLEPQLAGYLNRRGEAVPIYHLARLLHLPDAEPSLYDHILLLQLEPHGVIGLLTSGVQKIRQVTAEQLIAAPETQGRQHQPTHLVHDETQFIPLLDRSFLQQCLATLAPTPDLHLAPLPSHAA